MVRFSFAFPGNEGAKLDLGFLCTGFYGKLNVQSEYFLRSERSDLPENFIKKGFKLKKYETIKKKACETDSLFINRTELLNGSLVLTQKEVLWVFAISWTHGNEYRDAEMYTSHIVRINPYSGKIHSHEINTY